MSEGKVFLRKIGSFGRKTIRSYFMGLSSFIIMQGYFFNGGEKIYIEDEIKKKVSRFF